MIPSYEISHTASCSRSTHTPGSKVGSVPSRGTLFHASLLLMLMESGVTSNSLRISPRVSKAKPAPYLPAESRMGLGPPCFRIFLTRSTFTSLGRAWYRFPREEVPKMMGCVSKEEKGDVDDERVNERNETLIGWSYSKDSR